MKSKNPAFQILRLARKTHHEIKNCVKAWRQRATKENGKASCSRCTKPFCCSQFVLAHAFEGTTIAWALMQRNDKETLKAIIAQGKRQAQMILDAECQFPYKPEEFDNITSEWFVMQEPCALLKDARCSVYGLRPVACSSYLVYSPPEQCGPPSGGLVKAANGAPPLAAGIALDSTFMASLIDFGEDKPLAVPVPLGIAVLYGVALLTEGPDALLQFIRKERPYGPAVED